MAYKKKHKKLTAHTPEQGLQNENKKVMNNKGILPTASKNKIIEQSNPKACQTRAPKKQNTKMTSW